MNKERRIIDVKDILIIIGIIICLALSTTIGIILWPRINKVPQRTTKGDYLLLIRTESMN